MEEPPQEAGAETAAGHQNQLPAASAPTLDPVPASLLAKLETKRRGENQRRGTLRVGCGDVDEYVLMGGLERGTVVGVSAEREDEFGLVFAVQIMADSLCRGVVRRVLVITPKPASAILGVLRDGIRKELESRRTSALRRGEGPERRSTDVRSMLDRVMLSCVFDMDGVWEVLADLDRPAEVSPAPVKKTEEIQDSEDEDDEEEDEDGTETATADMTKEKILPDLIIITHVSSLLTGLFSHRTSTVAHSTLQLLSSHLRHVSRSLSTHPVILLLNSTNADASSSSSTGPAAAAAAAAASTTFPSSHFPPPSSTIRPQPEPQRRRRPVDPTLRSIFNAPYAISSSYETAHHPSRSSSSIISNKPAFGLVFTQFLDLHLLCTRQPRTGADAEAIAGVAIPPSTVPTTTTGVREDRDPRGGGGGGGGGGGIEYVTVVEVLLDQMGVWDTQKRGGVRKNREQRWAPVIVKDGRVVEAFERTAPKVQERRRSPVRVVAGFGGPRV